jgi:hypothetical protein
MADAGFFKVGQINDLAFCSFLVIMHIYIQKGNFCRSRQSIFGQKQEVDEDYEVC